MSLTIRRTGADEYGKFLKVLVCGDAGAGKTRSSSTWPNPLIASINANLMSVADREVPYVPISSSTDLLQLKLGLDNDPKTREELFGVPVDTVIIDTIDHFQQILVAERKRDEKRDTMAIADYGWLGDEMRSIIRGFRNLPLHVVFHAHLKLTEDMDSNRVYFRPSLQGAVGDEIAAHVDIAVAFKGSTVTQPTADGNGSERVIVRYAQTYRDLSHPWIRDNSGKLPPEFEINFEDDFARMEAIVHGKPLPQSSAIGEVTEEDVNAASAPESGEIRKEGLAPDRQTVVERSKKAVEQPVSAPVSQGVQVMDPGTETETYEPPSAAITSAAEPSSAEVAAEAALTAELTGDVAQTSTNDVPDDTSPPDPPEESSAVAQRCADCGNEIETEDQADLGLLRFRRALCKSCFITAKSNRS